MMRCGLAVVVLLTACGSENVPPGPVGDPPVVETQDCPAGERLGTDGSCRADAIAPRFDCEPGSAMLANGECEPAGIPADGCAAGFVHDGDRGCEPTLPPERCAAGTMAAVGDAACREVAPCGSGTWGDIPVEANTQYVDVSYAGGDGDGSAAKPWIDVVDAVAAAEPGAIVAIAAGSYPGPISVSGKAVRLWGRCPSMVEIDGDGSISSTLRLSSAAGSEVHQLEVHGFNRGIDVSGSGDVLVQRAWVHGYREDGVTAGDSATVTVRDSLLENNKRHVDARGDVRIERSVLRLATEGVGTIGGGLFVTGSATLEASLVEDNPGTAALVLGGALVVEGSVLRGTTKADGVSGGRTIEVSRFDGVAGSVTVRASLIEPGDGVGILLDGAVGVVERSVFRDGVGSESPAILAQPDDVAGSELSVRASLVQRTRLSGVGVINSSAILDGVLVRDVLPDDGGLAGRGIEAVSLLAGGPPTRLEVSGSQVTRVHEVGIYAMGADAEIFGTAVDELLADSDGAYGRGVQVEADHASGAPSVLSLRQSRIRQVHEVGATIVGSLATIEHVEIAEVTASADGLFGDGIVVVSQGGTASATIHAVHVHDSARAGIGAFGSQVTASASLVGCHAFDLGGETLDGRAFGYENLGGMWCGCGAPDSCKVVTSGVAPPTPMRPE
jgi:hypothetical protein